MNMFVSDQERIYTIAYGDAVISLTQKEMDRFLDAAGDAPIEPAETDPSHVVVPDVSAPDVITVTTSDGEPFSYRGQELPQSSASWVFAHALGQAIHRMVVETGSTGSLLDVFHPDDN